MSSENVVYIVAMYDSDSWLKNEVYSLDIIGSHSIFIDLGLSKDSARAYLKSIVIRVYC